MFRVVVQSVADHERFRRTDAASFQPFCQTFRRGFGYAKPIVNELRANMVRVDSNFSATPFKAKISNAKQLRAYPMLVIGGGDMEANALSVRLHHGGPQGAKPKGKVTADILAAIRERKVLVRPCSAGVRC